MIAGSHLVMVTGGGEDPDCWTNVYTNDNYQGECHPFYLVVDKDEGICAEIHCLSIYLTWKKSQEKNNFFFFILKVDNGNWNISEYRFFLCIVFVNNFLYLLIFKWSF